MLSLEWIPRLFSLDLMWFIYLAMDGLLWVFLFSFVVFVYNKMKFSFRIFAVIVLAWLSFIEFFDALGIVTLAGGFIFVYYIGQFVILNLISTVSSLKNRIPFVLTLYFLAMFAFYNIFMK